MATTALERAGRTAMARAGLSRPVQLALADSVLDASDRFFDYGCGRGDDVRRLANDGIEATGWDPYHSPQSEVVSADVVNLGFVLNVIEEPRDRVIVIRDAWALCHKALVVSARPDWEAAALGGRPHLDGVLTSKGTFQKFYDQDELRTWISGILGVEPVAAAPGIFYVFRDAAVAASVRARRLRTRRTRAVRPRQADLLWDQHEVLLEPLVAFWEDRGRLPVPEELADAATIIEVLGSLRRAAGLIRRVLGADRFEEATERAVDDLSVFLALEAFSGRPRFSELPDEVARDVRALFGSYKSACAIADDLLFSMGSESTMDVALQSMPFGKVLPEAVYVHADYVGGLQPLVRVYEGSGRVLLGEVEEATIVKMSRRDRRISYLSYPRFEQDPHPALATSLRADLQTFRVKWRDFRESINPPVLHRKELFVPEEHETRDRFARLTRQEERAGLFVDTSRIGTRNGWAEMLTARGRRLRGHRLVREPPSAR